MTTPATSTTSKPLLLTLLIVLAGSLILGCGDSGNRNGKTVYPVYGPGSTGNIARSASASTGTGGSTGG